MRWISRSWCWITSLSDGLKAAVVLIATAVVAEADEVRCTPALPVFCANVHVGCSGRTEMPTQGFMTGDGQILFDDGAIWRVDIAVSDSGVVYRREEARDWIRIDPDGRFSQRVYRARGPVMTYGVCE